MLHYLSGDATAPVCGGHKFIIHVCNDGGFWNKGFVLSLSQRWREPEAAYRRWARHKKMFKLGNIQRVIVAPDITVFNMLAQSGIRSAANLKPICYDSLAKCLAKIAAQANEYRATIHLPRIGCGLAGGNWLRVSLIIDQTLSSQGIHSYVYDLAKPGK